MHHSSVVHLRARGFTMNELVIVLVVVAVLGVLAIPTYRLVLGKSADETTRTSLGELTQNALNIHFSGRGSVSINEALASAAAESVNSTAPGVSASGTWNVIDAMDSPATAQKQVSWFYSDGLLRTATLAPSSHQCFAQGIFGRSLETWCGDNQAATVKPVDGGDSPSGVAITDGPGEPGSFTPSIAVSTTTTAPINGGTGGSVSALNVAPTNVTAIAGSSRIELSWSPVAGAIGYYVYLDQVKVNTATTSLTEVMVDGLSNGHTYDIKVAAYNDLGAGPRSSPITATPRTVPSAPAVNIVTNAGSTAVVVSWSQPNLNGTTLTGYTIQAVNLEDATSTTTTVSATTLATTLNVAYGVPTQLRVRATVEGAASLPGMVIATTRQAPPVAASSLSASPANASVVLNWPAVTGDLNAPVTGYRVYVNGSSTPAIELAAPVTSTVISGLTNGLSYSFALAVHGPGGESSKVFTSATPITTPATAPAAAIGSTSPESITLNWAAVPSTGAAPVSGYHVYLNGAATPAGLITSANTTTYTLGGLVAGTTYSVAVAAFNSQGDGPASATLSAVTVGAPQASPAPLVVLSQTGSTATLQWTNVAATTNRPVNGYRVYRNGVQYATLAHGDVTYTAGGLVAGTTYTFAVSAYGAGGESAQGNVVTVTPVNAVGGLSGGLFAVAGNGSATLVWTPMVSTVATPVYGYHIYLNGAATAYATITDPAVGSFAVNALTNGTSYQLELAGFGPAGDGARASTTVIPIGAPATPATVTAASGDTNVTVSWDAMASSAAAPLSGFRVYAQGTNTVIATASASATSLNIGTLTNGTTYLYDLVAYGPGGTSARRPFTATPYGVPAAPAAPSVSAGSGQATVTWAAQTSTVAVPVTGYVVFVNGANAQLVVGAGTTSKVITGLTNGVSYSFTVAAAGPGGSAVAAGTGIGPVSAAAVATPLAAPGTPTNFTGTVGSSSLTLNWDTVVSTSAAPVSGYNLYLNGSASVSVVVAAPATTKTITGLINGTAYSYQIAAYGPGGTGPLSTAISLTPSGLPDTPSGLAGVSGDGSVVLSWTAVSSTAGTPISGYYLYLNGATSPSVTVNGATTSTYSYGALTNGTAYTFKIASFGPGGTSAQSTSVAVTPYGTPATPAGLSAVSADASASLSWTPLAATIGTPISGYYLYLNGATSPSVTVNGATTSTYSYGALTNGTAYTFKIASFGPGGTSAQSTSVAVTPRSTPKAATVTTSAAAGSITLSWVAPNDGGSALLDYELELTGVSPASAAGFTMLGSLATTKTISGLPDGYSYSVRIRAYNALGAGLWSTAVAAGPTIPAVPSGFAFTTLSESTASSSWTNPTYGVSWVETSLNAAAGVNRGLVSSFSFSALSPNTAYNARVRACNAAGCSAYTTSLNATTAPAVPAGLSYLTSTSSSANYGWTASTGATRYEVSINNAPTPTSTTATSGGQALSAGATALAKVRACNATLCSAYSANVTIGTTPAPVTGTLFVGLSGYSNADARADWAWSWTAQTGATSYKLYEAYEYFDYGGGHIAITGEHSHILTAASIAYADHSRLAAGNQAPLWNYFTRYNYLKACNTYGCSTQTRNSSGFTVRTWLGLSTLDITSSALASDFTNWGN